MSLAKVSLNSPGGPWREAVHDGVRFMGNSLGVSYDIYIDNLSRGRLLAVVCVDGLNVIDASPAATSGPGYVVDCSCLNSDISVNGWRTSSDAVARFVLSEAGESYAAKQGAVDGCGVIAVAIFREESRPPLRHAVYRKSVTRGGDPTRSGTGFGPEQTSHSHAVDFVRTGTPEVHLIRYGTVAEFVEAGYMRKHRASLRSPFERGFCPRPSEVG